MLRLMGSLIPFLCHGVHFIPYSYACAEDWRMKKVSIRASELSFRAPVCFVVSVCISSYKTTCAHEKTNICFASVVHAAERWSLSVAAGKSTYLTVTTRPLSAGLCTALKCEVCPQAQARWDRARLSCRKPGEPDDLEEGALECHATRSSRRSAVAPRALDEGHATGADHAG